MNTLRPATSHHRQAAQRSMHRWLQLAPVDESYFLSNLCSSLKEGWACNREKYEAGVTQQPFGSHFTSSAPLWTVHFILFSQRAFLHSSQGRSRLCPLRHSSLLSGPGSWRNGVMRRQGTCYVNLGGKAPTYLGKCPFITSYTHSFSSDSYT